MAYDYLIDRAIKDIWCTPNQDYQYRLEPEKITPARGVWNSVTFQKRRIELPVTGKRFHVYTLSQLPPSIIGLIPSEQKWTTVAESMRQYKMIANIYDANGVQLPRFGVWYQVTRDRTLLMAVQEQDKIALDYDNKPIFMRVYSNAFYRSERYAASNDEMVYTNGGLMKDTATIVALQQDFLKYKAMIGSVQAFINGYLVSEISLLNTNVNDLAEFVFDGSVKKVVDFDYASLRSFSSTLDQKQKYLLHYPKDSEKVIDFFDDIDFYICKPLAGGKSTGVYYHLNLYDSVRMVTHRDYSLVVPYVLAFLEAQGWGNESGLFIRAFIREAGYARPLVFENNRIHEMYKLPDEDITRCMLGIDSTVPNWRAEVLEASAYTQIMRSPDMGLSKELVQQAYGYNAISGMLANTPQHAYISSLQKIVDVPYGLRTRAVGYEFDEDGTLLGWFSHSQGAVYATRHFDTRLVEMLAGVNDDMLDEYYGQKVVGLDPNANYRMYVCDIVNGVPTNQWRDVTGTGSYIIVNNKLTWSVDMTQVYTLVRSDKVVLGYSIEMSQTDGIMKFSLSHRALRNGVVSRWVMQIPMGELNIYLNGRRLIEGLDYDMIFPQIVIRNKEYQIDQSDPTAKQIVSIRYTGFCTSDFKSQKRSDFGFISHGILSHNGRYDIQDDKVLSIAVDGYAYAKDELQFDENSSAVTVGDQPNGRPYEIQDNVVPLRGYTTINTYTMRAASIAIDEVVSDYMTEKYPMPVFTTPNVIKARYTVFSPFCCKVMNDLRNGILDDARIKEHYGDQLVAELCAPYLWLLDYDPTQDDRFPDPEFVEIHPHNENFVIDLDIYAYTFLFRAAKLYLKGRTELSRFIRLKPTT